MYKKSLFATAVGGLVFLSACSSGSGSADPSPNTQGNGIITRQSVAGPLDPVQEQLSSSVISPLADVTSGTPLGPVLHCADQVVVQDTLDIADSVLAQLQEAALNGGTPGAPDPAALAASLESLVVDLSGLLNSLGDVGDGCLVDSLTLGQISAGGNPLEGTPLAPVGAALQPVLAQLASVLDAGGGAGGEDLQLTTVSALVSQLNTALQGGLAQVPSQAYDAPVVGGVLTTVSTALNDIDALLAAAGAYNAGGTQSELQNTVYDTVVNVLTQVVPVTFLEAQAGQQGVISGQIESAAAQLSSTLASALGNVTTPVLSDVLAGAAEPALDPIENQVLPAILGPILDALSGGGVGSTGDLGSVFSGTPLAPAIDQLTTTLTGLLGGSLGGLPLGGASCPLAGVPLLSVLCGLTG